MVASRLEDLLLLLLGQAVLLPDAEEAVVGTRHADLVEGIEVLHLLRNDHRRLVLDDRHGQDLALELLSLVELSNVGVAELRLAALAREDDQFRLVRLEALRVELQRLSAAVAAAVVNSDANGARLLAVDSGLLELSEGEAAALAHLVVIFDRGRVHHRPQQAGSRARRHGGRLGLPRQTAAVLARGLVEPRADMVLLAHLVEVLVWDLVVVLHHGPRRLAAQRGRDEICFH